MECTQVLFDSFEDSSHVSHEPKVEATLEVNGSSFDVMTGENIIGRDPDLCNIVLQFQAISAEHAKLDAGPDGHTLCDMGSRNKTRLKEKVLKPHVQYFIEDGDPICFADVKAVYRILPAEEKEKADEDDAICPETPTKHLKRIDESMAIPETPDCMNNTDIDDSFVPCSQSMMDNTLKNMSTTSETSFVASSQPPQTSKPSTSGTQLHGNGEQRSTSTLVQENSQLRTSLESQTSFKLVLSESLTDNDTQSRSLDSTVHEKSTEDFPRVDAATLNGDSRSIYEADTQVMAFSESSTKNGDVSQKPDEPDSRDSTPDLDESSLYAAETQIVLSPDNFKKPASPNVRRLSLPKLKEDIRNGSPDLVSVNESIYEADTQLLYPTDIDSPTVQRGSQSGTPGREESLYEADMQVFSVPTVMSHPKARKSVQFSAGNQKKREDDHRDMYAAQSQVLPLADDSDGEDDKLYEAETQVLPGRAKKDPPCTNEELYEAETQVLREDTGNSGEAETGSIYDAETQALPLPESEDLMRINGHAVADKAESAKRSGAESECDDTDCEDILDREPGSRTDEFPDSMTRRSGDASDEEDPCLTRKTAGTSEAQPALEDKKASVESGGDDPGEENIFDCPTQKIIPKARSESKEEEKPKVSTADDSDDTDEENIFKCPTQRIQKARSDSKEKENKKTSEANDDTDEEDIFNCPTQKITPKPSAKSDKKENDGDDTDEENIFNCPTQKITPKSSAKSDKKENDGDDTDEENIFNCPTQKITPKPSAKSDKKENDKISEENNDDDMDEEDLFIRPVQKITPKARTKLRGKEKKKLKANDGDERQPALEDKKASAAKSGDDSGEEDIFDCPPQKVTPKARNESEEKDKKASATKDSDDTDEDDIFNCPTQKITPKTNNKSEEKEGKKTVDVPPTKNEESKASTADDGDENIFACPTQKITKVPEVRPDSKGNEIKQKSNLNVDEDADKEKFFNSQILRSPPRLQLVSEGKEKNSRDSDGDNTEDENIGLTPSPPKLQRERVRKDEKESKNLDKEESPKRAIRPSLVGTSAVTVGSTNSELIDESSNDSETLLKDYKEDDECEASQSSENLGTMEESQADEPLMQSRDSTPDHLSTLPTNEGRLSVNEDVPLEEAPVSTPAAEELEIKERSESDRSKRGRPRKVTSRMSQVTEPVDKNVKSQSIQETLLVEKPLQSSTGKPVEIDGNEEHSMLPGGSESPKPKQGRNARKNSPNDVSEPKLSEKSSPNITEKPVEMHGDEEDSVLPGSSESPKPKQGRNAKRSSPTKKIAVSKLSEELSPSPNKKTAEINDSVLPGRSESPEPKRGRVAKKSSQSLVAETKHSENLSQSSTVKPVEEPGKEDNILPGGSESPKPKPGRNAKRRSPTEVDEPKRSEKLSMRSMEKTVETRSNEEDKLSIGSTDSPKPKRGRMAKSRSQTLIAELSHTELLMQSSTEKPVEARSNEEGSLLSRRSESPNRKRGRPRKAISQTLVAEPKSSEKLRQGSTKRPIEEPNDEEDNLLSVSSESLNTNPGKKAETNSLTSNAESKSSEKLSQSLTEKPVEKPSHEEYRVLPGSSELPKSKRGRKSKTTSQTLVAERSENLDQGSTEKQVETRSNEVESLLRDSSHSSKPKRGRVSKTRAQSLVAEPKPSEKLSQSSTEKHVEKRGKEEESLLPSISESPRPKRGKATEQRLETEKRSRREETASTSTKSGVKRHSPEDEEKKTKRIKIVESPEEDDNVRRSKTKRPLYSPAVRDNFVPDSDEDSKKAEEDDASTPKDEDTARRSGRVKKPTWKIRGGDGGLTKTFVLSCSQDTDDAAEMAEEDVPNEKKRRGRPRKSSLTRKESPSPSPLRKKTDDEPQPRTSGGRFVKRSAPSIDAMPTPPKRKMSKNVDVPSPSKGRPLRGAASRASFSKKHQEESDDESHNSFSSETSVVVRGRRRRFDSTDSVQSTTLTRSSSMLSTTPSPSRRSVQRQAAKPMFNVLFTGFADGKLEKQVLLLGGKIVDSIEGATVAVTDKLRRTVKLLSMMAGGQPIVSPDWITQSEKAGHFQDPWKFLLSDVGSEKKFQFNMERSLRSACSKKLLDGYTIFVTKNVSPPPDAMEDIIKSSGGVMVKKMQSSWPEKSVIISCPADAAQIKKLKSPPLVVVAEWLLSGVLQQRLDSEAHKLVEVCK